ncbi:MAG TPA: methylmalonyl-CoA mutase subunit beta [Xanthobacteraceae bacterium]|nr:methylmalonyl-CoA mutase subunit beta [Xanthobacteraceae bacterium]
MTRDADDLPLAAEFPPATYEQWRKLVDGVLKGAPFETLQSRSADGLTIEPLYPRAPDATPVAGRAGGTRWQVMQRIDHPDPDACNAEVLHELDNGADGLVLIPAGAIGAHGYGIAPTPDAIERVLAGMHLDAGIAIALEFSPHDPGAAVALATLVERQGLSPAAVDIRFGVDPLGAFARHGRSSAPWRERPPRIGMIAADLSRRGFKGPFTVADGRVIHDAGGTEAQELAFTLASAVAYLRGLEAGGIALDAARRMIAFRMTADADQFLTIAKFRALRRLWQRVEESCGLTPAPAFVEAETAWRSMTRDDAYMNILRATIAVFSAGVGGADAITVLPFTAARGLPDRFARRVARNTQLVLLEEAGIAHVADPTAGIGWSEDLTDKLCHAAWALFQEIEAAGGLAVALERGLIQAKVAVARAARERALADKKEALIGASEYPGIADVPVLDVPHVTLDHLFPAAVTCEPLAPVRFAAPFESGT